MLVGTSEILFAPAAFVALTTVAVAPATDDATVTLTTVGSLLLGLSSSDAGFDSGTGEPGGDVFISMMGAVDVASPFAPFASFVPLPFIAELLPNCKYADNLGKMSFAFRISLLQKWNGSQVYYRADAGEVCARKTIYSLVLVDHVVHVIDIDRFLLWYN